MHILHNLYDRKSIKMSLLLSKLVLLRLSIILVGFGVNKLEWVRVVEGQKGEVKIGVVLDKESVKGKVRLSCINMALSDWCEAHPGFRTNIVLHVGDSRDQQVVAAAVAGMYISQGFGFYWLLLNRVAYEDV